jgi:hypothetical protein
MSVPIIERNAIIVHAYMQEIRFENTFPAYLPLLYLDDSSKLILFTTFVDSTNGHFGPLLHPFLIMIATVSKLAQYTV